jgi:hypothetical protein
MTVSALLRAEAKESAVEDDEAAFTCAGSKTDQLLHQLGFIVRVCERKVRQLSD